MPTPDPHKTAAAAIEEGIQTAHQAMRTVLATKQALADGHLDFYRLGMRLIDQDLATISATLQAVRTIKKNKS